MSATQVLQRQSDAVPKKTKQNNNWSVSTSIWKEWAANHNECPATKSEPGFPIPLNVGLITDYSLLDYWMQRFVLEIRRKDGKPYPPSTLTQIVNGIQRLVP